jgi:hypothetical protein
MGYMVIGLATRFIRFLAASRTAEPDFHLHWDRDQRTWAERKIAS